MPKKYESLDVLIAENQSANQYFSSLPAYVKEQMSQRASSINSLASLQDYADNLLRGDD